MADVVLNSGLGGATQTSTLGPEFKTYYQKNLLVNARQNLVYGKFGKKYPLPKGQGKTMEWRKVTPLPTVSTPLVEGVNPDSIGFTVTSQTVSINQYGAVLKGTDIIQAVAFDPLLDEISTELGVQAGQSMDEITRDALVAGTNVIYANGRTTRNTVAATDVLAANDLIRARAILQANNVPFYSGGDYVSVVHPYTTGDLLRDSTIRGSMQAGDHKSELYDGELGRYMGIKFYESGLSKVFTGAGASSANVYATLIFGKDAYGITELSGNGLEFIYKPKGSAGTSDPLELVWSSGWKTTYAVKILQESFMIRVEHAATNG